MPTLVRLLIVLIILAGLGFAGMIALTVMVDPGEKDVIIKIPARDLVSTTGSNGPIDVNNLPAPVNVAPKDPSASSAPASGPSDLAVDENASESGVKTVTPGGDE